MPSAVEIDAAAEPTNGSGKTLDAFHKLVRDINIVLDPSSGLTSADVDPKNIEELMRNYSSNEAEWKPYAMSDPSRTLTRNLVDRGNGKSNLLVLVWTPGKTSPIHDHANSHCVMKVLRGSLKETLYTWPDRNDVNKGKPSPLKIQRETVYTQEQVTYMSDDLGLHKLGNPDPENFAVSLHLYTPPNAAKVGCFMFNQHTGASSHMVSNYFFSEMGQKLWTMALCFEALVVRCLEELV